MEHYIQHPDGKLTPADYVSKDGIQTEWELIEAAIRTTAQSIEDMAETLTKFGKDATTAVQSRGPQPRKRIPPRDLRPKRNTYQR